MARLSETDRQAFQQADAWMQAPEMRSPHIVEPTPEARGCYCRWATEAAKFFKGTKPVRFQGEQWKL